MYKMFTMCLMVTTHTHTKYTTGMQKIKRKESKHTIRKQIIKPHIKKMRREKQ